MSKIWDYKSNETDNLSKQVAKDPKIVFTKPSMAKHLLETIEFEEGDKVLEPCLGEGAFYNNFPSFVEKDWCEINEGKDFLLYEGTVDYTISNPPFVPRKLFWDFHKKAMEISKKAIYWLINVSALNVFTSKRLKEMNQMGWYINSLYFVSDKRWYGRYVFIRIDRNKTTFVDFCEKSF
jgi:hypothetical protein